MIQLALIILNVLLCRLENILTQLQLRIPAIHGAKTTKSDTPGTFCLIFLQPDRVKIPLESSKKVRSNF